MTHFLYSVELARNQRNAAQIIQLGMDQIFSSLTRNDRQLICLDLISSLARSTTSINPLLINFENWAEETLFSGVIDAKTQESIFRALGSFCFCRSGKLRISSNSKFVQMAKNLANDCLQAESDSSRVVSSAIRFLATLGLHEEVALAVGRSFPRSRGCRILSLDGGGMKGLGTLKILEHIEKLANCALHEMFDLVVGTSTGALLAVALMLKKISLPECQSLYKHLGTRVFKNPLHSSEKEESWMEAFFRSFHSRTEHVRAVVIGCKHDSGTHLKIVDYILFYFEVLILNIFNAGAYEELLKENCKFDIMGLEMLNLIDTACLNVPKVALVSTLTSMVPAQPYIFRNYEYPLMSSPNDDLGSSQHQIWEAVRASSGELL